MITHIDIAGKIEAKRSQIHPRIIRWFQDIRLMKKISKGKNISLKPLKVKIRIGGFNLPI